MKRFFSILSLLTALAAAPQASQLSTLAASMAVGTWAELQTTGMADTLFWMTEGGGSDAIFNYSDDLTWNPVSQEAYYIGGSHYGPGRFVAYSAAANAWREVDRPAWLAANFGHGYDHNAIDQTRQWFYHNPMNTRNTVHVWEIANKRWRSDVVVPTTTCAWTDLACCRGIAFYPWFDRGGVVYANGKMAQVYFFGTTSGKWWTLGSNVNMATYHNIAKTNPVQKVVYLGGGNGENTLNVLDSAGTIRPIAAAPVSIGIYSSCNAVDPASGDLLVLTGSGFYSYHLATDRWTTHSMSVPVWSHGGANVTYTVAGDITDLGVTMWCKWSGSGKVWLYKHAAMQGSVESTSNSNGKAALSVFPNPFNPRINLSFAPSASEGSRTEIFNVNGGLVAVIPCAAGQGSAEWDGRDSHGQPCPMGVYSIRLSIGHRSFIRQAYLIR